MTWNPQSNSNKSTLTPVVNQEGDTSAPVCHALKFTTVPLPADFTCSSLGWLKLFHNPGRNWTVGSRADCLPQTYTIEPCSWKWSFFRGRSKFLPLLGLHSWIIPLLSSLMPSTQLLIRWLRGYLMLTRLPYWWQPGRTNVDTQERWETAGS